MTNTKIDLETIVNQTPKLVEKAIRNNWKNIQWVRKDLLTDKILSDAIWISNGEAAKLIPNQFLTNKLIWQTLNESEFEAIEWLPLELLNEEKAWHAVQISGFFLEDIPLQLRTAKVCWEAVEQIGEDALEFIPDELKTKKLLKKAHDWKPAIEPKWI